MHLAKLTLVTLLAASPALAQQPAKDRKDYIIEAIVAQRDDGLAKLALCSADATANIEDLKKQVTDLKAELAKAKPKE